jgi:hypothetical protein
MVSKQILEAIGTHKGREADEGKAPKGDDTTRAGRKVQREELMEALIPVKAWQVSPDRFSFNAAFAMTRRVIPKPLTQRGAEINTIMKNRDRCPTCGATLDSAVLYPDGEAFCMECGEVFDFAEKTRDTAAR